MSALEKLVQFYKEQNRQVPVQYYTSTGMTLSGTIECLKHGYVQIRPAATGAVVEVKINVKRLAGPAEPCVWCLTRMAMMKYNELLQEEVPDHGRRKLLLLAEIFDNLAKATDDVTYHFVKAWPGMDNVDNVYAGFVSFNLHKTGEPLSGYLVNMGGDATWVHGVPEGASLSLMERP